MAEFEVIREILTPSSDPARAGKQDLVLVYTIDGKASRLLTLPAEGQTRETIQAAIRKDATARPTLSGFKFS